MDTGSGAYPVLAPCVHGLCVKCALLTGGLKVGGMVRKEGPKEAKTVIIDRKGGLHGAIPGVIEP